MSQILLMVAAVVPSDSCSLNSITFHSSEDFSIGEQFFRKVLLSLINCYLCFKLYHTPIIKSITCTRILPLDAIPTLLLPMQDQNSSLTLQLPPPPPPLTITPPVLTDTSYQFYLKRKHLNILNGEPQFGSSSEEVEYKMKKVHNELEGSVKDNPSNPQPRTIDLTLLSRCARCDRWLYTAEIPIHESCHASIILDNLLLGDRFCSQSSKELIERMAVTHIVNAAVELPNYFEKQGIKYLNLALEDTAYEQLMGEMEKAYAFIKQAHQSGGRVFVHCAVGKSRSVSAILVYLMRQKGYDLDQALTYVKERRPIAQPNMGYMRQLRQYNKKLQQIKNQTGSSVVVEGVPSVPGSKSETDQMHENKDE